MSKLSNRMKKLEARLNASGKKTWLIVFKVGDMVEFKDDGEDYTMTRPEFDELIEQTGREYIYLRDDLPYKKPEEL